MRRSGYSRAALISGSLVLGVADAAPTLPPPPVTIREHWGGLRGPEKGDVELVDYDDGAAVYFDKQMSRRQSRWLPPFIKQVWRYTEATYGPVGNPHDRLYAIFHQGDISGGWTVGYFDPSRDHRDVTENVLPSWGSPDGRANSELAINVPTHEVSHIVEGTVDGIQGSPARALWHDSKFAEIFIYDTYVGIGMQDVADKMAAKFTGISNDFPRPGTHWFRDFFYPAWRDHGRSKLMPAYFHLVARYYPTVPAGDHRRYARDMNWGEFIHFMSGAAGVDLRALATKAFGWPPEREQQFRQARAAFPSIVHGPPVVILTPIR